MGENFMRKLRKSFSLSQDPTDLESRVFELECKVAGILAKLKDEK
jgi:hypothetical protein